MCIYYQDLLCVTMMDRHGHRCSDIQVDELASYAYRLILFRPGVW